ncbi:hypothetical protein N1851_024494 [Merluccius polli]|uniref:HAT C-terminal dimerisation domain-containing protein n=1 Tax=Merluccius polli TaxID=89951 RepID=A0AA47MF83_MERPO|nr:hypothetical protein N1851_024494 [Merluccius polli]
MKRTIDRFFVKKNSAVLFTPVLSPERPRPDPAEVTAPPPVSPVPGKMPNPDPTSSAEMASSDAEQEPTTNKKAKIYAFRKEWHVQFPLLSQHYALLHLLQTVRPKHGGKSAFAVGASTFRIETLKKHNISNKHVLCRDRCVVFQCQEAANRSSEESEIIIKCNTAYNIAKEELLFTKFKSKIIHMKKNRLNVNPTYSDDTACAQFIVVIADTVQDVKSRIRRETGQHQLIGHIEVDHANAQANYLSIWELMMTKEPYCSEYKNILHLVHIMLVLPVSSAVCERGFSSQKRIKSDVRASLHTDTVEDLCLEDFDARESVANWFTQGQRARRPHYRCWPAEGDIL